MNFYVISICNFSILIGGIIALMKFKKIKKVYYPFIYCLWIGCLNEILSFILLMSNNHTLINSNIYVLLESFLILWFLKEVDVFKSQKTFYSILLLFLIFWLAENFIYRSIVVNSTYFRIFYSFIIVLLSITLINKLVFNTKTTLLRNSTFILLISFVIYFTCKLLIQSFVIYGVNRQSNFLLNIYMIMIYINLGVNLLYALAVLWMPKRVNYS
jgi:hypothetical protein